VGRYYFESLTQLPVEVEIASELRYRNVAIGPDDLVVSLTQSGETADTLGAMEHVGRSTDLQIVITNVPGSQATRIAAATMEMRAGLEMGVAATKTFTSSVACLYLLAMHIGNLKGTVTADDLATRLKDLAQLPRLVGSVLEDSPRVEQLADQFLKVKHFLYLGRGDSYPIALEGALKLKEIHLRSNASDRVGTRV
jgi:glucosamine--fructose-6-phosphate aminotransferase (isomerizing)